MTPGQRTLRLATIMFTRAFALGILTLCLGGCVIVPAVGALAEQEVEAAITAQLETAVSHALEKLGAPGGFERDPAIHVPLPPSLRLALPLLQLAGLGPQLELLDSQINQTEEQVAAAAFPVYSQVIRATRWQQDGLGLESLLSEPQEAMRRLATDELQARIVPLVEVQARDVGLDHTWGQVEAARQELHAATGGSNAALHAYLARQFVAAVARKVQESESKAIPAATIGSISSVAPPVHAAGS